MQRRSPISALVNPRAVLALGAGILAGVLVNPWLILPGVVAYIALVRSAVVKAGSPYTLEVPHLGHLQGRNRRRAEIGMEIQKKLAAEMQGVPPYLQDSLGDAWAQARALGERQLALVEQLHNVEEGVRRLNPYQIDARVQELTNKRDAATDAAARAQYEQALQSALAQRENVEELRASAQRLEAQVDTVQQTLESVYGQVLRIKTADAQAANAEAQELTSSLQGLTHQVSALSESVEQVHLRIGTPTLPPS
jgi:hypothetical protein